MTIDAVLSPARSYGGNIKESVSRYRAVSDRSGRARTRSIPIRLVSTSHELEAIYQFRYQVYVEEMRRHQFYADHSAKKIEDPLDRGATNFAALQDNEVVGTVRVNFPRTSNIEYYEAFMDMCSAGCFHPSATSICTRLMVAPRLRRTSLAMRLTQASYEFGLRNRIRYNFIDCDDHLIGFFIRLGYIVHRRAEHPEYGMGNVMRLDLLDRPRLVRQRSPFLAILDQSGALREAAPHLN
ncbi:MAG TPA: GNAT family N-acetyltransferase [Stellaceae bacterium]|nr:GNAT family N-acetyltransferase [Stellaceae bacterium]